MIRKCLFDHLGKLTELQDGWWGKHSVAPSTLTLMRGVDVVQRLSDSALVNLSVIPRVSGALTFESESGVEYLHASIDPDDTMFLMTGNELTDALVEYTGVYDPHPLVKFLETGQLP